MEALSKMTTLTPKCEIFYRRTKWLKASQYVHNPKLWGISNIPPPTKNVTLSYPHKIDWRRLTYVSYGSFTGSETLKIYIYSSLTVRRQSIHRQWYEVCELKHRRIYMSANLFVCMSVSLSYCLSNRYSDLRHCLGLKHNFFRDVPKSKQSKENMWRWLWTTLVAQLVSAPVQCSKGFDLEQKNTDCMSICLHKPTILFS